ncbi:hypothetical protein TSH7_03930 [Azospirillum sp. TSH7]|uniref:hypothetical protein n=1 Tax=unclassified Azospirillum TaxID=2630922 RepID=UPI000D619F8B|nr:MULTISPECIES: hypothetical protein [unclassified Azospirillum]PWC61337.1 hypothetical protein TSH20_23510 [Azospirillum sp. TSH20]PWC67740.1 hypothetical protein TSH7_03930 [Azospirillum sp. TSH7]
MFKGWFSERAEAVGDDEDIRRGEKREYDPRQPVVSSIQAFVRQQPSAAVLDDASDLAEHRAVGLADLLRMCGWTPSRKQSQRLLALS